MTDKLEVQGATAGAAGAVDLEVATGQPVMIPELTGRE